MPYRRTATLVLLAAAQFGLIQGAAGQSPSETFFLKSEYSIGSNLFTLLLPNLNSDGFPDMVVVERNKRVHAFLGNGDGTFRPTAEFEPSLYGLDGVVVGDFDGDGRDDLAADDNSSTLFIFRSNGDGTFQPAAEPSRFYASRLGAGDFNNDGLIDLLACVRGPAMHVQALLSNGDFTFTPGPIVSALNGDQILVTDLDRDGRSDVIMSFPAASMVALLGAGNGQFGTAFSLPRIIQQYPAASADVDGNGLQDVLAGAPSGVWYAMDYKSGSFSRTGQVDIGGFCSWVTTGDFNGDGYSDALAAMQTNNVLYLIPGSANGLNWAAASSISSHSPGIAVVADLNHDGQPDFAVIDTSAGSVRIYLQKAKVPLPEISAQGVVDAAGYGTTIARGAWVGIFGKNLAPLPAPGRNWKDNEIVNGKLPTALEGVSVTIGGRAAAISFVGPQQINVQAPADGGTGAVEVTVTHSGQTARATVNLQAVSPAFFRYQPSGRRYVAAQHGDYSILAPSGLFPGAASSPARPGETIILYGSGFGPTNPVTPAGQVVTNPAPLANLAALRVTVGGVAATVEYAGVTMAGVWQINIRVPEGLPDGDARLEALIDGTPTQGDLWLAVHR